jgi:hypothetical protein
MTYQDLLLLAPPMAILCMCLTGLAWFAWLLWKDRPS